MEETATFRYKGFTYTVGLALDRGCYASAVDGDDEQGVFTGESFFDARIAAEERIGEIIKEAEAKQKAAATA